MTGYLYKRAHGAGYREAGCFAAAMSTLKLEHFGPFSGTAADILRRIDDRELDMTVRCNPLFHCSYSPGLYVAD